ncbi:MAG TPA: NAD(P)-dependent oxidoreductase [Usitatibacter sp.]|nr:NAD(P)-dependent oxidoreductase [Usitatibacter sp.]
MNVGIIGVGAMGGGVARALRGKGFGVFVRDIVPQREAEAVAFGCIAPGGTGAVARHSDVVITLVIDAPQTRSVVAELGAYRGALMMCSTIAPSDTEDIAARTPLLDAPISGGPARAREGTLSMMASGPDSIYERCRPVIEAMASKCFRIGDRAGDGSRMKVVNNMMAAANLAAGCEALAMAKRLGLDARQAVDVIGASSGGSWIFEDRMRRALEDDYAPRAATRVLLKDVGLFVHEARRLGLTAPMAECAREIFHDTVARGLGEEDDAAVLKRYLAAWNA